MSWEDNLQREICLKLINLKMFCHSHLILRFQVAYFIEDIEWTIWRIFERLGTKIKATLLKAHKARSRIESITVEKETKIEIIRNNDYLTSYYLASANTPFNATLASIPSKLKMISSVSRSMKHPHMLPDFHVGRFIAIDLALCHTSFRHPSNETLIFEEKIRKSKKENMLVVK